MNLNILPDLAVAAGIHLNLKLVSNSTERGPELAGPCPRCGGEDRFHVWPEQHQGRGGSFWCRQSGLAGDGIQFLREFGGLSFREAAAAVGKKLDQRPTSLATKRPWKATPELVRPKTDHSPVLIPRECLTPSAAWQFQAGKYVNEAADHLLGNQAALDKLEKERGISEKTARLFHLGILQPTREGYNCRFSRRSKWGLPPKSGNKKPDSLWLPRGLIIPAFNAADKVSRLRIRRPVTDINEGAKYYIVPGSSTLPLVVQERQPALVVVESELDAMLLHQEVGDLVGVLAQGNASARPDQATHDLLQAIPLVLLAFDNDEAGNKAVARWLKWYNYSTVVGIPGSHKDPCDAFLAGENLRGWIQAALPAPWSEPPAIKSIVNEESLKKHDDELSRTWQVRNSAGQTYYVVLSPADKQLYIKNGQPAFTLDEIEEANQMPEELRRAFLDFCCASPGSQLIDFRQREATNK